MLTARVPVKRFREEYITDAKSFARVFGPRLRLRGFRLDLPWDAVRSEDDTHLIVTQEVPGRLPNNDPRLYPLLQAIGRGESRAIGMLLGLLLAENDDRAEVLQELEVSVPEDVMVYADYGTTGEGHNGQMVEGGRMAEKMLCGKVLVLMGVREEAL